MPIDFKLREHMAPVAIWRLRRELERTQWLPPDQLREHQETLLRAMVRRAAQRVPHYQQKSYRAAGLADVRSVEDLARLPILGKDDVRAAGAALLARDAAHFAPRWHSTSGSTGESLRFALDRGARVLEVCYYWRHWSWAGYKLGDRFAEVGSHHFVARGIAERDFDAQRALGRWLVNAARITPASAPAIGRAFVGFRPRFLKGMASALAHLAHCLREARVGVPAVRAVFATGEMLLPHTRRLLEEQFGAPVLDSYGQMERTVSIAQCERGGYHINADCGIAELLPHPIAPAGSPLRRLVGTGLHNRAMPLIRYETGDDVEAIPNDRACACACACGRTLPLVKAIHGRREELLLSPDGRMLNPLCWLFAEVGGVRAAQIQRESAGALSILVVPDDRWGPARRERLVGIAAQLAGPAVAVRVREVGAGELVRDRSGKLRAVVSAAM
jgi:phenylacetate-CoA ligase